MSRVCRDAYGRAVAACNNIQCTAFTNCNGIQCTAFTNCNSIQCTSFTGCSWWNVPCHVARAACLAAFAVARAACWVARGACEVAAAAAQAACWVARAACDAAAAVARAACIAAAALVLATCEIVSVVLDAIGFIVELILSIPIIGGIIRTVLNWVTEIIWRAVGFLDFLASLAGIRPRKRMYFGVVVPSVNSIPDRSGCRHPAPGRCGGLLL